MNEHIEKAKRDIGRIEKQVGFSTELLVLARDAFAELEVAEPESKPERASMSEILVCQCGWYGTIDEQDALGTKNGCCPKCGNEDLDFLNEWLQIVEVWRSKPEKYHCKECEEIGPVHVCNPTEFSIEECREYLSRGTPVRMSWPGLIERLKSACSCIESQQAESRP